MFERFTDDARAVVVSTQELCPRLGADEVEPVHLLAALCEPDSPVRDLLAAHGLTSTAVLASIRRPGAPGGPDADENEVGEAADRGPLGDDDSDALRALGIDLEAVRRAVEEQFGPGALDDPTAGPAPAGADPGVEHGPRRGRVRLGRQRTRFGRGARKVLELAVREAVRRRGREITAADVALGVLRTDDLAVRRVLWECSADHVALRADLEGRGRYTA